MNKTAHKFLAIILLTIFSLPATYAQSIGGNISAKELIRKMDEKMNGEEVNVSAEMTMTIVRPNWKREMSMKTWGKGQDYSMVLITGPARDKGAAFLKREKEIWNWQPTIERVIKLPPSMMSQSWMGSDMTNDDLVQQSSLMDDFSHEIVGNETIDGRECYIVELIPHEDAAVVWGKIRFWVDTQDFVDMKAEFYDEDDYLINTFRAYDIKEMDGKILPSRLEIIPEDEPGHKTILEYKWIEFDDPVKESFFSVQNMKRLR